jgi:predicted MFS family arabinose efflux permease
VSLGTLAWALSQIGSASSPSTAAPSLPGARIGVLTGFAVIGLTAYAWWERTSAQAMTPPRLAANRAFVGLNVATFLIYAGLSIVFFLLPFELVERRGRPLTDAGLAFLPFTLGVGVLSRPFGTLADKIGARAMLIAGPVGTAVAYLWMAWGRDDSLLLGVIAPMTLLGISFAALITPLTASVMSSVEPADEGLASGVNNTVSRVAQLIGVALAAGVASFASGYQVAFLAAAALSFAGALVVAATVPPAAVRSRAVVP